MAKKNRRRGNWERPSHELAAKTPQTATTTVTGNWSRAWSNYGRRPMFDAMQVEQMLLDSRVAFALRVNAAPLLLGQVKVNGPHPAVNKFVGEQWDRLWSNAAPKIVRTPVYGFSGYEVMYREVEGRWEFDKLLDRDPLECRVLTQAGRLAGMECKPNPHREWFPRDSAGGGRLLGMKALWLTHSARYGRWYGESSLEPAYPPSFEKRMTGGAQDLRRLRMVKDAWLGLIVGYPMNLSIVRPDGVAINGRDIAREIQDSIMSGGAVAIPTDVDQNTRAPLFTLTRPTDVQGATPILEWSQSLDGEIWEAIVGAKEIAEAAESGGFSGRSIPFLTFLMGRNTEFNDYLQQTDAQILRPLVCLNYGEDAACEYEIKPVDLVETVGKLMGGGQPQAEGGQGQGQGGAPQFGRPMVGNTPPAQVGRHGGGGMVQLSETFNETDHPRDGDGKFAAGSGGGAGSADPAGEKPTDALPPVVDKKPASEPRSRKLADKEASRDAEERTINKTVRLEEKAMGKRHSAEVRDMEKKYRLTEREMEKKQSRESRAMEKQQEREMGEFEDRIGDEWEKASESERLEMEDRWSEERQALEDKHRDEEQELYDQHLDESSELEKLTEAAMEALEAKHEAEGSEWSASVDERWIAFEDKYDEWEVDDDEDNPAGVQLSTGDFDETDHPRAADGEFTAGAGGKGAGKSKAGKAAKPAKGGRKSAVLKAALSDMGDGKQVGPETAKWLAGESFDKAAASQEAAAWFASRRGEIKAKLEASTQRSAELDAQINALKGKGLKPTTKKIPKSDAPTDKPAEAAAPTDAPQPKNEKPAGKPKPAAKSKPAAKKETFSRSEVREAMEEANPIAVQELRKLRGGIQAIGLAAKSAAAKDAKFGGSKFTDQLWKAVGGDYAEHMRTIKQYMDIIEEQGEPAEAVMVGLGGWPKLKPPASVQLSAGDELDLDEITVPTLRARLSELLNRHHSTSPAVVEEVLSLIREFQPELAQRLTTDMVSAWVEGAQFVAEKIPASTALVSTTGGGAAPVNPFGQPANAPPPFDPFNPFSPPTAGDMRPRGRLLFTERAIADLRTREPLPASIFYALEHEQRQAAFTITADLTTQTLDQFRGMLAANLRDGASYNLFREDVLAAFGESPLAEHHLENVFRTNAQTAFSQGKAEVLSHPVVADVFPYRGFNAIRDTRVRHEHLALEKSGLDGTNVYYKDDPTWLKYQPPIHYNCRCNWVPLTVRQAARKGVKEAIEWLETGVEPPHPNVPPPADPPIAFTDS